MLNRFKLNWNNAFLSSMCVFFSTRSKVAKGVKRSISFLNGLKKSTISNRKNNSVNVLDIVRDEKVSTVTPSSDLPLRGQRSKKVKFQKSSTCMD